MKSALSLLKIQGVFVHPSTWANFTASPIFKGVILSLPCIISIWGLAFFCRILTKSAALTVMVRSGVPTAPCITGRYDGCVQSPHAAVLTGEVEVDDRVEAFDHFRIRLQGGGDFPLENVLRGRHTGS